MGAITGAMQKYCAKFPLDLAIGCFYEVFC